MKIAMIGHKRIPTREGGVEICVEELAMHMVEAGHDVHVYNRRKKDFKALNAYKGVKIINVPTIDRKSLDAVVYSFLATIRALFGNYDIIHYHALGPSVMSFIPKMFGIKVVCTVHGLDWQRAKWGGFGKKYLMLGERIAARYANAVIVLSNNMQRYFKEKYNVDTIYIQNGVSSPVIREPEIIKEKYGLVKDSYILFLARIVPEKGLHYLVNAYQQIDTDIKLVICGGGSHTDEYLNHIKKIAEQDNRIIMTGFVQGQVLEEFYSNALLYVLPSEIEGMPLSLLEAMSYGLTCLVSDIPENVEVIKEHGITFKTGNHKSLENELICFLINHQQSADMSSMIRNYIKTKFSWSETTNLTLQCYQKILRS